jgi:hypothetical protein
MYTRLVRRHVPFEGTCARSVGCPQIVGKLEWPAAEYGILHEWTEGPSTTLIWLVLQKGSAAGRRLPWECVRSKGARSSTPKQSRPTS